MPVIVFASPKGGAGKSTSAVILATQLALKGATVTAIDADPNRPVSQWARRPGCPENLTVLADVSEATIIETIEDAARRTHVCGGRSGRHGLDDGGVRNQQSRSCDRSDPGLSARRLRSRQGRQADPPAGEGLRPTTYPMRFCSRARTRRFVRAPCNTFATNSKNIMSRRFAPRCTNAKHSAPSSPLAARSNRLRRARSATGTPP